MGPDFTREIPPNVSLLPRNLATQSEVVQLQHANLASFHAFVHRRAALEAMVQWSDNRPVVVSQRFVGKLDTFH
jgi:hypothetical protein